MRKTMKRWTALGAGMDRKAKILSLVLVLGVAHARADSSGNEGYGMIVLAVVGGVGTSLAAAGGGAITAVEASSPTVAIVAGVVAALSGVTATGMVASLSKEVVLQVKIDHETYLAGGAMTPMLQEVYRQVKLQTSLYDRVDCQTGIVGIDEERMGAAIDRLVELAMASGKSP